MSGAGGYNLPALVPHDFAEPQFPRLLRSVDEAGIEALASVEVVDVATAVQNIVALYAKENIFAIVPDQEVVTGAPDDTFDTAQNLAALLLTLSKVHQHGPRFVRVVGQVNAVTSVENVTPLADEEGVESGAAQHLVDARPTIQGVASTAPDEPVAALITP